MARTLLNIDTSEFNQMVERLSDGLSKKQRDIMVWRALRRSLIAVRVISVREVTAKYRVTSTWARDRMRRFHYDQANLTARIDISGARGKTARAGEIFPARSAGTDTIRETSSGASVGRKLRNARGKSGRVYIMTVRGQWSKLPQNRYQRHFMITRGPKAGRVYVAVPKEPGTTLVNMKMTRYQATRAGHKAGDVSHIYRSQRANERIRYAVGIGVPQMPMTRAAPEIQARALEILSKRLQHEYQVIIDGIATGKGVISK